MAPKPKHRWPGRRAKAFLDLALCGSGHRMSVHSVLYFTQEYFSPNVGFRCAR